ncbi:MAG: phosphoribosyl-ATP diphosphatase [Acidobacteria bacterium]|nr:phosphoribosyl-ATP diphosphatase [Acidobacteriota bacterium]
MADKIIQSMKFDERGLIPAVVQDAASNEVLRLGYMDNASLLKTLQTGQAHFVPSGDAPIAMPAHKLLDVRVNADGASLTVFIEYESKSTESRKPKSLLKDFSAAQRATPTDVAVVDVASMDFGIALHDLYSLIAERKDKRPEGSYTTYLFNSGLDKILKKIAEEAGEVIIAAKNRSPREIVSELSDLFYHLLVLMVEREIRLADVHNELKHRASQAPKKK